MIGIEENQPILNAVLGWMETFHIPEYQEATGKGLVRNIMIRCGFATGQIMVVIVANADRLPHEAELVKEICGALPGAESLIGEADPAADSCGVRRAITGIVLNTNKERTNVILGRKNRTLWGSDAIEDAIGNIRYRISPLSFYQVNPYQTRRCMRRHGHMPG